MKENLQSSERRKKGAPIHLILGYHGDTAVGYLNYLDRAIGDNLQRSRTGNVVILVEDGYKLKSAAKLIERGVEKGLSPSFSYGLHKFIEQYRYSPRLDNPQDIEIITNLLDTAPLFLQTQLTIFDKYHNSSRGRIRLLWEHRPNKEILDEAAANIPPIKERYQQAEDESIAAVLAGNFDFGLGIFKKGITEMAEDSTRRDDRLVSRIREASENPENAAIIGYRGSTHTRVGHILSKEGYSVTRIFPEIENGLLVWGTANEALRTKELFPNREISEREWYRFMLGEAIFQEVLPIVYGEMSLQQALHFARRGLLSLDTMDAIRRFEHDVRQKGFIIALEEF